MATAPRPAGTAPASARRQSIRRRTGPASPVSFEGLRSEGVRRVQGLSGHTWTDYNLHDPGVTILEQLCYALTDLVYRIGFPIADHLAGPDNRIDYSALALHGPAQVFPCRATTVADYRRALLDTLDAVDNAWVGTEPVDTGPSAGVNGLYRIALEHAEQVPDGAARASARHAAAALYRRQRNLCEDLDEVTSVAPVDCHLQGAFEIGGARSPEDILADILDECARAVAGGVAFRSFQAALADHATLDEILDGSHARRGVIAAAALRDADRDDIFVGDLVARLCTIEGVRAVRHLAIAKGDEPPTGGSIRWELRREALRLQLPPDVLLPEMLRLTRAGSTVAISAPEVREKYLDLRMGREARRHGRQEIASLMPPPTGTHRDLRQYFSIQNHFPAVYGINAHGLPASATPEARAMAAQLKTYLAMFEQVIADGAAHLHHLRDLFSARDDVRRTYWWQPLGDDMVPGLGALLAGTPEEDPSLPDARARHDAFYGRRHRVLDHLLALHGETYTQNTLRQLACYYAPAELEEMLLANKLAYLGHILHIGRNRGSGFDYSAPSWGVAPDRDGATTRPSARSRAATVMPSRHANEDASEGEANVSGFQLRASLLLGFRHQHSRPLTQALRDAAVEIHGSASAERDADPLVGGVSVAVDDDSEALNRVPMEPRLPPGKIDTPATFESLRTDHGLLGLAGRSVSLALLRHGVDLANYRVGHTGGDAGFPLMFRPDQSRRWWVLGTYDTVAAANRAANHLRRFLVNLNVESEGMHVVEHVLLRQSRAPSNGKAPLPTEFLSLRLTVVLPAWTARGQTAGFRRLAEETVQINCPAHVLPGILWLGYADMMAFEQRYEHWLEAKVAACRANRDADERVRTRASIEADVAGRAVAEFLMRKGVVATPGPQRG